MMRTPYTPKQLQTEVVKTPNIDKWGAAFSKPNAYAFGDPRTGIYKLKQALEDIDSALLVVKDATVHIGEFISPAAKEAFRKDLIALVDSRLRSM